MIQEAIELGSGVGWLTTVVLLVLLIALVVTVTWSLAYLCKKTHASLPEAASGLARVLGAILHRRP